MPVMSSPANRTRPLSGGIVPVAMPNSVMIAKARMIASHNGAPFSMQPTTDSAASGIPAADIATRKPTSSSSARAALAGWRA